MIVIKVETEKIVPKSGNTLLFDCENNPGIPHPAPKRDKIIFKTPNKPIIGVCASITNAISVKKNEISEKEPKTNDAMPKPECPLRSISQNNMSK